MKPKERRDRSFKDSRPNIREMKLVDENGYTQDMKILWGAYKKAKRRQHNTRRVCRYYDERR